MNGILLVDKPAGWTSHDVVAKVRSKLKQASGEKVKVGHTGTLDPMATGLLILVIGRYTKRAAEFSKLDKVYEAEITLGANSSTGDAEGQITPVSDVKPSQEAVQKCLESFVGQIEQTPPAYSAIKVGGRKAYELARQGKVVKIEPRLITIYEINDIKYAYPKISFSVLVSSGTYIRSLATDVGKKLGSGAYLSALRRTSVGDYTVPKKALDKTTIFDIIRAES